MCWVCQDQETKARKVRDKIMRENRGWKPKKPKVEMLTCSGCSKPIETSPMAATDPLGDPMHKECWERGYWNRK